MKDDYGEGNFLNMVNYEGCKDIVKKWREFKKEVVEQGNEQDDCLKNYLQRIKSKCSCGGLSGGSK